MANNNYKLTQAEFKGKVLASLSDIKEDIRDIKVDLKSKACKEDVQRLRKEISNIKLASAIIGGIGGVLTALGAFLGLKKV